MSEAHDAQVGRRTVLRAAAGLAGAGATLGTAGTAAAQNTLDQWFGASQGGETGNYDGVVDKTGSSSVTVEVGAEGNGGPYAFTPAAIRVDPGTTVTFSWVSDTHNIMIESQPSNAGWKGHESIENQGFEVEHTFETKGITKYYCQPHLAMGMKGAVVVGDVSLTGSGSGGDGSGSGSGGESGSGSGSGSSGGHGGSGSDGGMGPIGRFNSLMVSGTLVAAFLSPILFGILLLLKYDERNGKGRGKSHGHGPQ